ncbi:MAG: nuclear transport factor 2 family protein [Acidimicrobiales bacterium]
MPEAGSVETIDDINVLAEINERFIEACRQGSWALLEPLLSPSFSYVDGATGEVWGQERYIADLESHPAPELGIDEVTIHVAGDVATVSARSSRAPGRNNRYLDTYARVDGQWLCVHACVWPLG